MDPAAATAARALARLDPRGWPARTRLIVSVAITLSATTALVVLVVLHAEQIWQELTTVEPLDLVLLVGLYVVVMALRTYAWDLGLRAAGKRVEPRQLVGASAVTFLTNTVAPSYLGNFVRIVMLRRIDPERGPTFGQMAASDAVLLVVETYITVVLVIAATLIAGASWLDAAIVIAFAAVAWLAVRVVRRRFAQRQFTQTFKVFEQPRRLWPLVASLVVVLVLQAGRFYAALDAVGLDPSVLTAVLVFVATSIFASIPIGVGAATVSASAAVIGSHGLAAATAAGLLVTASAFAAALLYTVLLLPVFVPAVLAARRRVAHP